MAIKIGNFHYPLTVDGYRVVYKGYLHDPDLQDARARWPFVAHLGQSRILLAGPAEHRPGRARSPQPGQTVKVAANQAWFEYIPARVKAPSGSLDDVRPAGGEECADRKWDDNGLGIEPNNLKAINSLIAYRSLRYGRHLDLIITDQHSFRGSDPFSDPSLGRPGY